MQGRFGIWRGRVASHAPTIVRCGRGATLRSFDQLNPRRLVVGESRRNIDRFLRVHDRWSAPKARAEAHRIEGLLWEAHQFTLNARKMLKAADRAIETSEEQRGRAEDQLTRLIFIVGYFGRMAAGARYGVRDDQSDRKAAARAADSVRERFRRPTNLADPSLLSLCGAADIAALAFKRITRSALLLTSSF